MDAENVSGTTGKVSGAPEDFRRPTGRGHKPRKATWAKCGREPAPRWAGAPPHTQPRRTEREGGETLGDGGPKAHIGVRHPPLLLGRRPLPSRAAGPLKGETLKGAPPLPSPYI